MEFLHIGISLFSLIRIDRSGSRFRANAEPADCVGSKSK
jgi:hypothetical protein